MRMLMPSILPHLQLVGLPLNSILVEFLKSFSEAFQTGKSLVKLVGISPASELWKEATRGCIKYQFSWAVLTLPCGEMGVQS